MNRADRRGQEKYYSKYGFTKEQVKEFMKKQANDIPYNQHKLVDKEKIKLRHVNLETYEQKEFIDKYSQVIFTANTRLQGEAFTLAEDTKEPKIVFDKQFAVRVFDKHKTSKALNTNKLSVEKIIDKCIENGNLPELIYTFR